MRGLRTVFMGLDGPLLLRRLEEEKIKLYCLVSVSLVTLSVALHWLGPVMVPLILAFMLSYMLSPLVDLQVQKLRVPQVRTAAPVLQTLETQMRLAVSAATAHCHGTRRATGRD